MASERWMAMFWLAGIHLFVFWSLPLCANLFLHLVARLHWANMAILKQTVTADKSQKSNNMLFFTAFEGVHPAFQNKDVTINVQANARGDSNGQANAQRARTIPPSQVQTSNSIKVSPCTSEHTR
jgi:hypothetical protein